MLKIITFSLILFFVGCGSSENTKNLRSHSVDIESKHIHINEVLSANAHTNIDPDFKQFSDWIELYNDQNKTIDISGYYLSDSKKNPTKWKIPENITMKPHSYLLIWADGQNIKKDALHTNFKLSQDGERVTISDRNGDYIDSIKYDNQEADISCTKVDDNLVYMSPTPEYKNSKEYNNISISQKPNFSQKSGFYAGEQTIELSTSNDSRIYYSLDGSIPTTQSKLYEEPITIDKTTVIKARSIEKDKFMSKSISHTYLIDEDISLPVMSISIDDKYLNDDEIGIIKNYLQETWIRPASVEFIKDGESKFSENVGIKLHGGSTRKLLMKSFSIFKKEKYGKNYINYNLFVDKPNIKKVRSFMLRNSGNDWKYTYIRDAISHSLAKDIGNLDYLSYEPIIAFINGEYYGILNLREKPNEDYIVSNYNVDKHNIDLIKENSKPVVLHGDNSSYKNLINFVENNSLEEEKNYQFISSQINIDELINYVILQSYVGSADTHYNNTKMWMDQSNNPYWRWILYDTDFGFALKDFIHITNVNFNTLQYLIYDQPMIAKSATSTIFRSLLENDSFKNKFLTKYNNLLDGIFLPENINQKITTLKNKIAPEIPRHLKKWFGENRDIDDWENDVEVLYDYSNQRNEIVREQLQEL